MCCVGASMAFATKSDWTRCRTFHNICLSRAVSAETTFSTRQWTRDTQQLGVCCSRRSASSAAATRTSGIQCSTFQHRYQPTKRQYWNGACTRRYFALRQNQWLGPARSLYWEKIKRDLKDDRVAQQQIVSLKVTNVYNAHDKQSDQNIKAYMSRMHRLLIAHKKNKWRQSTYIPSRFRRKNFNFFCFGFDWGFNKKKNFFRFFRVINS